MFLYLIEVVINLMTLMRIFTFCVLCFLSLESAWAQTDPVILKKEELSSKENKQYPLTRDSSGLFPKYLEVKGEIVAVSPGTSCGIMCTSGTIEIKLSKYLRGYVGDRVFVALACFTGGAGDLIGKKITVNVEKLELDNNDCFWATSINNINSYGTPFYIRDRRGSNWKLE